MAVALAAAVLLLVPIGCGSKADVSSSSTRQRVEQVLRESGYPATTATCATQRMYAALTDAELRTLSKQAGSGGDQVTGTLRAKVANAIRGCVERDNTSTSSGSSNPSSSTSSPSPSTSVTSTTVAPTTTVAR
jgi:hypothetical protein